VFHTDNAEAFGAENLRSIYEKYQIFHRRTPVYEPKSNGSVERSIKAIEEGLRVELMAGAPAQEAIHIVCGRLNRTVGVPSLPNSILTPREVVFKFLEQKPFYRNYLKPTDYTHDLNIGQRVLVKIPNAPKLSPQYEDRSYKIFSVAGNHVYSLIDDDNTVLKNLYRRDRLKPLPETVIGDDESDPDDNAPMEEHYLGGAV
jgi:hypothetical protein